jgi:hypothetical protein
LQLLDVLRFVIAQHSCCSLQQLRPALRIHYVVVKTLLAVIRGIFVTHWWLRLMLLSCSFSFLSSQEE